jgi:hypothetical protein
LRAAVSKRFLRGDLFTGRILRRLFRLLQYFRGACATAEAAANPMQKPATPANFA